MICLFSFKTPEGQSEIIRFLGNYFRGNPISTEEATEFLDSMLGAKQCQGVTIGVTILIQNNEIDTLRHLFEKHLRKENYLDLESDFAKELGMTLSSFDHRLGDIGQAIAKNVSEYEEEPDNQRFVSLEDLTITPSKSPSNP